METIIRLRRVHRDRLRVRQRQRVYSKNRKTLLPCRAYRREKSNERTGGETIGFVRWLLSVLFDF